MFKQEKPYILRSIVPKLYSMFVLLLVVPACTKDYAATSSRLDLTIHNPEGSVVESNTPDPKEGRVSFSFRNSGANAAVIRLESMSCSCLKVNVVISPVSGHVISNVKPGERFTLNPGETRHFVVSPGVVIKPGVYRHTLHFVNDGPEASQRQLAVNADFIVLGGLEVVPPSITHTFKRSENGLLRQDLELTYTTRDIVSPETQPTFLNVPRNIRLQSDPLGIPTVIKGKYKCYRWIVHAEINEPLTETDELPNKLTISIPGQINAQAELAVCLNSSSDYLVRPSVLTFASDGSKPLSKKLLLSSRDDSEFLIERVTFVGSERFSTIIDSSKRSKFHIVEITFTPEDLSSEQASCVIYLRGSNGGTSLPVKVLGLRVEN